jgi:CRP-like cAMP-binding protein
MRSRKKTNIPIPEMNITEIFQRIDFFNDLDKAVLSKFEQIATVQNFQNGETIMLAGDGRKAIFFIAKGQAKIIYDSKSVRSNILSLLGVGDFFGEVQLFSEKGKSPISVKAEEECVVIIFKGKDFLVETMNIPKLSITFLTQTMQKLNRAYMQIAALTTSTIKGRIKSCIMLFIDERGVRITHNNVAAIKLKNRPTQQQLAEMSGTTRETVNRELAALIKDGYIELDGKDLILLKELPENN